MNDASCGNDAKEHQRAKAGNTIPRSGSRFVRARRLDDFVLAEEHAPPGLLLVNVGGEGGKVLRGARETLCQTEPLILCEIHSVEEQDEIEDEVATLGYAMRTISNAGKYPRRVLCEPRTKPKIAANQAFVFAAPPAILRRGYLQHSFQGA